MKKKLNITPVFPFIGMMLCFANSPHLKADAPAKILLITYIKKNDPVEKFLKDMAQQTVFDQVKLLLITQDDKLDDSSEEAIDYYRSTYENIEYNHCNTELSYYALANQYIRLHNAEFVMILPVRDFLYPNTLKRYIRALEQNNNLDIVYGDYYVSYDSETSLEHEARWYLAKNPEYNAHFLYYDFVGPLCLWRATMHERFGYFSEDLTYVGKLEFLNRAMSQGAECKKISGIAGCVYCNYHQQERVLRNTKQKELYYSELRLIQKKYANVWHANNTHQINQKAFVIICPSYNNKDWYLLNLDSLINQNYTHYRIIYIDDASVDNTGNLVQTYIADNQQEHRIALIKNENRVGALANIFKAVHSCKPDEIIILVDGDDWLAHPDVLNELNQIYQNPEVWMTYGQFIWFPHCIAGSAQEIPEAIIKNNSFREYAWAATHLRTFYAGLFQHIEKEDLLYQGNFFPMAWDLAILFPMLEMAETHSRFVTDILYVYNTDNNLNDHKINRELQQELASCIIEKEKYVPLSFLF